MGTAPWDHRPLIHVWLMKWLIDGAADGIIAFDPSSFPKRGTIRWASNGNGAATGENRNCNVGVFMVYVVTTIMPCSTSACPARGLGTR